MNQKKTESAKLIHNAEDLAYQKGLADASASILNQLKSNMVNSMNNGTVFTILDAYLFIAQVASIWDTQYQDILSQSQAIKAHSKVDAEATQSLLNSNQAKTNSIDDKDLG